ncbi:hypothetical protein BOTU111921_25485 [Bordetella tumbae]|uniref:hypothetical protein n=1 Tax=Bordetella tumbae TaxID=1649139 RepID=UPI0039F1355F
MVKQGWQWLTACAIAFGLAAPGATEVLYDRDGLRGERVPYGQTNPATGQRQSGYTYQVTFNGAKLCGDDVSLLLFPGRDFKRFYCAGPIQPLPDGMLVFFTGGETALARVRVMQGRLQVQRISMSSDAKRDSLHETRFLDAGMAGWTRIQTAWEDTVMIQHMPFQVVYLGEGRLLDISDGVAYLARARRTQYVQIEPDKWVDLPNIGRVFSRGREQSYQVGPTFRAVRWPEGRELARLDLDSCTDLPKLEFSPGDGPSDALVKYADLSAWRAQTLVYAAAGKGSTLRLAASTDVPRRAGCTPDKPPKHAK